MLKRVGLFGVRRRINEIVEFINEVNEDEIDLTPWIETVGSRLDNAIWLFGVAFRQMAQDRRQTELLTLRVEQLEKWKANRMMKEFGDQFDKDINDESLGFCLEAIEGLDARLSSLEDALSPLNETAKLVKLDQNTEENK